MKAPTVTDPPMQRGATISACGLYRYSLTRRWGKGGEMCFVMLNPSTADGLQDDPTVRRCIGFAKRQGFSALRVVNVFAFRATDPRDLLDPEDPIGPGNNAAIAAAVKATSMIVAAWGASVPSPLWERIYTVHRWLTQLRGRDVQCLGVTFGGYPRHPLYLRADQPLEPLPMVRGGPL